MTQMTAVITYSDDIVTTVSCSGIFSIAMIHIEKLIQEELDMHFGNAHIKSIVIHWIPTPYA